MMFQNPYCPSFKGSDQFCTVSTLLNFKFDIPDGELLSFINFPILFV